MIEGLLDSTLRRVMAAKISSACIGNWRAISAMLCDDRIFCILAISTMQLVKSRPVRLLSPCLKHIFIIPHTCSLANPFFGLLKRGLLHRKLLLNLL